MAEGAESDAERHPDGRPLVLVVDDSPLVFEFVRDVADGQGWDAQWAAEGGDALLRLGERAPDLVLLDLQMPGMDGQEFLSRLRAERPSHRLPIVLISGSYTRDIGDEMRALGVMAVLAKPVPVRELVDLLHAAAELRS